MSSLHGGDSQIPRFSPGSQTEMPPWEKCTPEKGRLAQVLWEQPGNPALCRVMGPQKGSLLPKDTVRGYGIISAQAGSTLLPHPKVNLLSKAIW